MAPKKILICGGGCAGPSLAFWLVRAGHQVTIVERFPALRASGAQIDLRAQGIDVARRMGLLETIRSKCVDEAGLALIDSNGNAKATFMANKTGKGAQSMTSEFEIMRGDLVRILYEATKDKVKYIFGKTVEGFEQDGKSVTVKFSDGQTDQFDILVGADGQGSRIREAILPPNAPDPYRHLGLFTAYWFVPRIASDNNIRKNFVAPGSRWVMSRTHSETTGQAYFFLKSDSEEYRSIPRASIETQKSFWSQKFGDLGWQTKRFIDGMQTTDNFYCLEVVQVKIDSWSKGRVVLLADAAHCPSPMSGMGTTSALVGAYVLAGEIARNSEDLPKAFANYDRTLRPFVDKAQDVSMAMLSFGFPQTQLGIDFMHFIVGWISFFASWASYLRLPELAIFKREKEDWILPDYPEITAAAAQ